MKQRSSPSGILALLAVAATALSITAFLDAGVLPGSFVTISLSPAGTRVHFHGRLHQGPPSKIVERAKVNPTTLSAGPLLFLGALAGFWALKSQPPQRKVSLHATQIRFTPLQRAVNLEANLLHHRVPPLGSRQIPPKGFGSNGGNVVELEFEKRDRNGTSCLMEAALKGEVMRLKELAKSSEINAKDNFGWSALQYAVYGQQLAAAKALLDLGADVDTVSCTGRTPLMLAVTSNLKLSSLLVDLLLKEGADPSMPDKENYTAYDHSRRRNLNVSPKVRQLLKKAHGAVRHTKKIIQWLKRR